MCVAGLVYTSLLIYLVSMDETPQFFSGESTSGHSNLCMLGNFTKYFVCCFFFSFSKLTFSDILSGVPSECQTVGIQIRVTFCEADLSPNICKGLISAKDTLGSAVVACLTRDQRSAGSSLTGVTGLWSLSKTHLS